MPQISELVINNVDLVQSPYTYLQATGSNGSDGSTEGMHLRWDFRQSLGELHLPKGNLPTNNDAYANDSQFCRAEDFVKIYKVPYIKKYPVVLNFMQHTPDQITTTGDLREWAFDLQVNAIIPPPTVTTRVLVRFSDDVTYDHIYDNLNINPNDNPYEFLQAYMQSDGHVEVEAEDKLSFASTFTMTIDDPSQAGELKLEAISKHDSTQDYFISCRKSFPIETSAGPGQTQLPIVQNTAFLIPEGIEQNIEVENIKYIRFKYENAIPLQIALETYHDYITGVNNDDTESWESLGDYALSDDDTTVFNRLEGTGWNINTWPRFNGGNVVNVQNYRDKWRHESGYPAVDEERIKEGLVKYLTHSDAANPKANLEYTFETQADDGQNNEESLEISYLDMLKLVSYDFHIARMLGLGDIDAMSGSAGDQRYIYLMQYVTEAALEEEGEAAGSRAHFYMTMPTSKEDACLPDTPQLNEPVYGLEVPATPEPIQLTDDEGYLPYYHIRYIRLSRTPIYHELEYSDTFYAAPNEFCSTGKTETLFYGLNYRLQGSNWDYTAVSYDEEYEEIMPLPNQAEEPGTAVEDLRAIFTHAEKNSGIHEYALYGINWFSRTSALSEPVATNATEFTLRNTLQPPSNFAVQLIQKEEPRIFTTQEEQDKLADLVTAGGTANLDNEILVRATFYWNHVHYMGYQFTDENETSYRLKADKVQLFFREAAARSTRGKVAQVVDSNMSEHRAKIKIGPYTDNTPSPPVTYTPEILSGVDYQYLKSNEKSYLIDEIQVSGSGSSAEIFITIFKHVETQLEENSEEDGDFTATQIYTYPTDDEYVSLTENLSDPIPSTWPKELDTKVNLVDFETSITEDGTPCSPARIHKEIRPGMEGQDTTLIIGGIFAEASVTEKLDIDSSGQTIAGSRTGVYVIEFADNPLTDHPDADVEWYKGTVRIKHDSDTSLNSNFNDPDSGYEFEMEDKKVLEVLDIDTEGGVLKLTVVDSTFEINPEGSDGPYTLTGAYQPIETGSVLVNFHPGYRAYFTAETGFDQNEILPVPQQGLRQNYMSANAKDNTASLESKVSTPAPLLAIEIVPPLPTGEPSGPIFATRPDVYGKSTYTFDTAVVHNADRAPFALLFYRANERSILDVLYKGTTVTTILNNIAALTEEQAAFMQDYWHAMVNAEYNASTGEFIDPLEAGDQGIFQFPRPDNPAYNIPGTDDYPFDQELEGYVIPSVEVVENAIASAFLPLTEQPVIYSQMQDGKKTRKNKPVLYDDTGKRLLPSDDLYDPFPMVVNTQLGASGEKNVRFTDYTIDGASNSLYFYYSVEMSNKMLLGEHSPIAGPISLINAFPPEAPQIKKVSTTLPNPLFDIGASVKFEINKYLEVDHISGIQIYRTIRIEDAKSVRTMNLVKTLEVDGQAVPPVLFTDIQEQIIDDFSDLSIPPYGETLYYRIVALRKIINEQGLEENIPSQPSELMLTSLVDVLNPEAPELAYESDEIIDPAVLPNVTLKWNKTVHKGSYYLYKMNRSGNWELIETIKTNDEHIFFHIGDLDKQDDDGNTIYTRYKVNVENTSGLLNLTDKELTI